MPTKTTEELLAERQARDAERERGIAATAAAVDAANQQRIERQQQLRGKVLGAPPLPITASLSDTIARDTSYRDAIHRAHDAATTPPGPDGDVSASLRTFLERSLAAGDTIAARAALSAAFEHGYPEVADAYNAAFPNEADAVVELWQLANRSPSQTFADQLGLVPDPTHIEDAVRQGVIPNPDPTSAPRPGSTDPGPWPNYVG